MSEATGPLNSPSPSAAGGDDPATVRRKRRFLWRMVAVLVGGMFLDGYILGVIGPR